jgi:hypothetical protein
VGAFVAVQTQDAGDGIHDPGRRPGGLAALQAHVVLGADTGQQRHLLPAQALHPPAGALRGKAGVGGGDPSAPGGEELADRRARHLLLVHAIESRPGPHR